MPFTIEITSEAPRSRISLQVPSPTDRGLVWLLAVTIRAHFATRRLMRRLRIDRNANVHLSKHLRRDIGLPPSPPPPSSHWEIRT